MTNLDRLKAIMIAKNLSRKDVAKITASKPRSVDNWFLIDKVSGKPKRNMPDAKIKMLEMHK